MIERWGEMFKGKFVVHICMLIPIREFESLLQQKTHFQIYFIIKHVFTIEKDWQICRSFPMTNPQRIPRSNQSNNGRFPKHLTKTQR